MPNGPAHSILGIATASTVVALDRNESAHPLVNPLTAIPVGSVLGRLPDILEPAYSPNHRSTCHSLAALALVCYGTKKAYDWDSETEWQKLVRSLLVIGGACYAVHLFADALTPKSLPLM